MTPYTDFLTYKSGTYFPSEGAFKFNGQQALKIVGWEKSMQGDVWIIENSWGPEWGENGYAKVMANHNDIGLDYLGIAPLPTGVPAREWEEQIQNMSQSQGTDGTTTVETDNVEEEA